MKQVNLQIQNDLEELQQYGRCLSLRIDGVPVQEKEKSQDLWVHVGMFEEASAGNVDGYIDRAHGIGKTYYCDKKSSKKYRRIIVKFIIFWHCKIGYRLKKIMKDNIKVHVDLMKKRHSLLKPTSNLAKNVDDFVLLF